MIAKFCWKILFLTKIISCWIPIAKCLHYQYGVTQVNFSVHLRNLNKQHLILAKFYINNASFIGNQSAKFQLNLFTQIIVTVAFVRLPENVKRPVLGSRLFNPDNVHGLPGNSTTNFLAPYLFFCRNSLIKTRSCAENIILLLLFMLFWLRQQTSLSLERLEYVTPYWYWRYFVIDVQHLIILVRSNISQRNLAGTSGIYWKLSAQKVIYIRLDLTFLLHNV